MRINTNVAEELSKPVEFPYLGVGIHENVSFVKAETALSTNGNRFTKFIFTKDGKTFEYSEYQPTKYPTDIDESKAQSKMNNQVTRFDKILKCFFPNKEDRTFEADDYVLYVNWLVDKLNTADKSILLRMKTIYDDKGYVTFPRYLKYDFIQPMTAEKPLAILSMDQMVKPIVADKETVAPALAADPADDLPF